MRTYTATISQDRYSSFRRGIIQSGGAIVVSVVCEGGYYVTYTASLGALSRRMLAAA